VLAALVACLSVFDSQFESNARRGGAFTLLEVVVSLSAWFVVALAILEEKLAGERALLAYASDSPEKFADRQAVVYCIVRRSPYPAGANGNVTVARPIAVGVSFGSACESLPPGGEPFVDCRGGLGCDEHVGICIRAFGCNRDRRVRSARHGLGVELAVPAIARMVWSSS
jgi:hypothetical protein